VEFTIIQASMTILKKNQSLAKADMDTEWRAGKITNDMAG
jgi:hypothetical protein